MYSSVRVDVSLSRASPFVECEWTSVALNCTVLRWKAYVFIFHLVKLVFTEWPACSPLPTVYPQLVVLPGQA